jgi:hypothetical protein
MSENNCYLCQEPKSVVGHNTQSCPSVKCKKCGQKGHILRNCPNFNSNIDQKSDDGCSKEIKSGKPVDWILVKILGCPIIFKRKIEVKEILKNKSYGIDQRPDLVDPRISRNKENMDSIHNIEISNDIKSKLEPVPMDVVPPTHVEKGASPKKRSDSTTRKRTPREVTPPLADLQPPPRPQKHSDDRRRDTLAKDGAYIQSRGRSETRRRGTSRTETPSHSQEDLRGVIRRLNANKSRVGSKRRNLIWLSPYCPMTRK